MRFLRTLPFQSKNWFWHGGGTCRIGFSTPEKFIAFPDHGGNAKLTHRMLLLQADGLREDKVTRRLEIPVSVNIYGGMTEAELYEAQQKEIQLAQQDRAVELTKERKNALESYVYEMRNKV